MLQHCVTCVRRKIGKKILLKKNKREDNVGENKSKISFKPL